MPLAVHALDVDDVIVLLGFFSGISILLRCCKLCMGELPALQVVIMELIEVFIAARQHQNTGAARHCRASAEQENGNQDCQNL